MTKLNRKFIIFVALFIFILYISIANVSADGNFSDVQNKINSVSSGSDVYLDNTTYIGNGAEITVNKNLKIYGSNDSSKKSTLDARNLNRIFNVKHYLTVSFINLVLINGKTNGNNKEGGGGYYCC